MTDHEGPRGASREHIQAAEVAEAMSKCEVCDGSGYMHVDQWGYVWRGWTDDKESEVWACEDCHQNQRGREDRCEEVEDALEVEAHEAEIIVDEWFASDGHKTVVGFARSRP